MFLLMFLLLQAFGNGVMIDRSSAGRDKNKFRYEWSHVHDIKDILWVHE